MPHKAETDHLNNEPSGSVVPLPCPHSKGVWPTCYGYIRGKNPTSEQKLWMRANMVQFCEAKRLHLARIFHDWEVEPDRLNYPGMLHALDHADRPGVHGLLLGDLDFVSEPSPVLVVLTETILKNFPSLRVTCFVDERAFGGLKRP